MRSEMLALGRTKTGVFLQAQQKDPGIRYIDAKTFLDKLTHRQTHFHYKGHNSWISPRRLFEIEVASSA